MRTAMWLAIGVVGIAVSAGAQSSKDQLRIVERNDLSIPGREAIRAVDRLGPSSATGWHTHSGEMVGYVTEGEVVIEQEGTASQPFRAGQSFIVPAGVPHNSRNTGATSAEMFVVFIVQKDRAMSTPYRSTATPLR